MVSQILYRLPSEITDYEKSRVKQKVTKKEKRKEQITRKRTREKQRAMKTKRREDKTKLEKE